MTREHPPGRPVQWTGPGFVEVREGSNISFPVDDIEKSAHFTIVVRFEVPNVSKRWATVCKVATRWAVGWRRLGGRQSDSRTAF